MLNNVPSIEIVDIHTYYILLSIIAGNLITLLALLKSPTIREHATTAFVISLSISDLLFCSFSLPLTAVRFFQEVRIINILYITNKKYIYIN